VVLLSAHTTRLFPVSQGIDTVWVLVYTWTMSKKPTTQRALAVYIFDNDLKKSDFAESLGVVPSMLSKILSGDRQPSLDQAAKIEKITVGAIRMQDWAL
jgi:transcriptional regulator with XRE-family HTH domain